MATYRRITFTAEIQATLQRNKTNMLTEMGIKRLKKLVIKMARPGDDEWNAIIQNTVIAINRLMQSRLS